MKVLVPQGIGDIAWAMTKVQAVAKAQEADRIDVLISGGYSQIERRSLDFVTRFSFINSAEMRPYDIHPNPPVSSTGQYNYIQDGFYDFPGQGGWRLERVCALMPNGPLERGVRLEDWLPQYQINWDIWKDFRIDSADWDFANEFRNRLGLYAVFYLGPLTGNTTDGHNRGPLWKPEDWRELGKRVRAECQLSTVVVGAPYDAPYFNNILSPCLNGDLDSWVNAISRTSIGRLFALTSKAQLVISYQSGVGIVSTYLGTPTACFWRPRGDSISPSKYLSFEESMAHCWVPKHILATGKYKPLIYKRDGVDSIMEWAKCVV